MVNISVSYDGLLHGETAWFTFANFGPLTTTYTQPASCSETGRLRIGSVSSGIPYLQNGNVQCSTTSDWDCVPTGTATPSVTAIENGDDIFVGAGGYYSPGLYCPSGWATAGLVARDGSSSLTSSGFRPSSSQYVSNPVTILASILKPSETIVVCCPSSMTPMPDLYGGCYSVNESFTPTATCSTSTSKSYQYKSTTKTLTRDDFTETLVGEVPVSTVYFRETVSKSLRSKAQSSLSGIAYSDMLTIIHHTTDFASAATGSSSTAASASAASGTATSTTNAAGRLAPRKSNWDGLGAVVGISVAAMALGAAIIL